MQGILGITDAICIVVGNAIAPTNPNGIRIEATSIFFGCRQLKAAGQAVSTTPKLIGVAYAIAIEVG